MSSADLRAELRRIVEDVPERELMNAVAALRAMVPLHSEGSVPLALGRPPGRGPEEGAEIGAPRRDADRTGTTAPAVSPRVHRLALPSHFNGSIVMWRDRLLLASRKGTTNSRLFLSELAPDLRVRSTRELVLPPYPRYQGGCEDPRLFVHGERLHFSFTGVVMVGGKVQTHQLVAELDAAMNVGGVRYPIYSERTVLEKNWAFFSSAGAIHCVYTIEPHVILRLDGPFATEAHRTSAGLAWDWGHLRGGAPPVRVGDEYYHWFHGTRLDPKGDPLKAYYTLGLYTFAATPPFAVTRWCPTPLLHPRPVPGQKSVVFPCGALLRDGKWLISYGHNDREVRVVAFDAGAIEKQLVNVRQTGISQPFTTR